MFSFCWVAEARFAPEMDTLVEIYQSLETAAGPMIASESFNSSVMG